MEITTTATAAVDLDPLAVEALSQSLSVPMLHAGHPDLAAEVAAFNAATAHQPAVVVPARCAEDVAAAVRFGVATGLPVGVQATGHGAVTAQEGGILVTTSRMQQLSVDPAARTARIGAGVKWRAVIDAAAPYGLAPLSGSSSDVGVVGYTLGGGLGPLGRRYGFAADHVRSIDVVTGDGQLRTASADVEPELFWALRGGKGSFGIVTAIEVELVPVSRLYGGGIFYAGDYAPAVLHAWREWVETLPEETTTSVALLRLPDLPEVPEPLRGTMTVHVRVAHTGDATEGAALVAPMRAAAPALLDTVRDMPFTEADSIHMDPDHPVPFWEAGGTLRALPVEAVDALVTAAGADVTVPLMVVELRHLGGALSRPPAVPNAVSGRDAAFGLFLLGPWVPGLEEAVPSAAASVLGALAPWHGEGRLVNFLGSAAGPDEVAAAWEPSVARRLAAVKATYDPYGLFRLAHTLPVAGS